MKHDYSPVVQYESVEACKVSERSERVLRKTRAMNLAKGLQTKWLHPLLN